MAQARSLQVDLESTPYYHCITRCVRGNYLCGVDTSTGIDFSHRKQWIEKKIIELCNAFAIKLCEYSIMETHHHLILFVGEKESKLWTDKEIFERWQKVYPSNAQNFKELVLDPENTLGQETLARWRERLSSISWYMKALNEAIAKRANAEEEKKGKFWDARFKCVPLLDESALLTAMAYVALNPVRAKVSDTPEDSNYTGFKKRYDYSLKDQAIKNRLGAKQKIAEPFDERAQPKELMPFSISCDCQDISKIPFALSDYYRLVDITGRIVRQDKKGAIPVDILPILERMKVHSESWWVLMRDFEQYFQTAAGAEIFLVNFGKKRKRGVKGVHSAQKFFIDEEVVQKRASH